MLLVPSKLKKLVGLYRIIRLNSLVDTIASNKGYGWNNALCKLTYLLSCPFLRCAYGYDNDMNIFDIPGNGS